MENEKNRRIDHYLDALQALEYIMLQSKDYFGHWIEAIQRDIKEWQTNHNSKIHLGNYGGMGSFNDLGGDSYFINIQSIAYSLAVNPNNIESVEKSMGTLGLHLNGWHCSNCGYSEVYKEKIDYYVINHVARSEVIDYFQRGALLELAKKRANFRISSLENEITRISEIITNSQIVITNREKWKEICSKCDHKLDIFHWVLNDAGDQFIPYNTSADDLPDNVRSAFK